MVENMTEETQNTEAVKEEKPVELTKSDLGEKMIRYHAFGSAAAGLIPVPWIDMVALVGVQLNMLRMLSKIYEVKFLKEKGKKIIAAILASSFPVAVSPPLAGLLKAIPLVGTPLSFVTMPGFAGATTYALGKVFLQHFESGGTFLNFKPEKVKEHFKKVFEKEKGKEEASSGSMGEPEAAPAM